MEYSQNSITLEGMMGNLKLRPHHIASFADFEARNHYGVSDRKYIDEFRRKNSDMHTDKFVILWRNFLDGLHNNPRFKFQYISGYDSVCDKCDIIDECKDENNSFHNYVRKLDEEAINRFPELVFGQQYDGQFLRALFIKKGILREE